MYGYITMHGQEDIKIWLIVVIICISVIYSDYYDKDFNSL